MNSIWSNMKTDLLNKEYLDAKDIFLKVLSETYRYSTPNAKLFTDLYNWYSCGIEDGMYQFFEFEYRTVESLTDLGVVIKRYLGDSRLELTEDEMFELNANLNRLLDSLDEQPQISVTYFVPDEKKSGGKYVEKVGVVRIYDSYAKQQTVNLTQG